MKFDSATYFSQLLRGCPPQQLQRLCLLLAKLNVNSARDYLPVGIDVYGIAHYDY